MIRTNPYTKSAKRDLYDFLAIVKLPKELNKSFEKAASFFDLEIEDIARVLRPKKAHYGNVVKLLGDMDEFIYKEAEARSSNVLKFVDREDVLNALDGLSHVGIRMFDHYGIEYVDEEDVLDQLFVCPFSTAMMALGKEKELVGMVLTRMTIYPLTIDGVSYEPDDSYEVLRKKHAKKPFDPAKK